MLKNPRNTIFFSHFLSSTYFNSFTYSFYYFNIFSTINTYSLPLTPLLYSFEYTYVLDMPISFIFINRHALKKKHFFTNLYNLLILKHLQATDFSYIYNSLSSNELCFCKLFLLLRLIKIKDSFFSKKMLIFALLFES